MKIAKSLPKRLVLGAVLFLAFCFLIGGIYVVSSFLSGREFDLIRVLREGSETIFPMRFINVGVGAVLLSFFEFIVSLAYGGMGLPKEPLTPLVSQNFVYLCTTLLWGAFLGFIWHVSSRTTTSMQYVWKGAVLGNLSFAVILAILSSLTSLSCAASGSQPECGFGIALIVAWLYWPTLAILTLVGAGAGYRYGRRKNNIPQSTSVQTQENYYNFGLGKVALLALVVVFIVGVLPRLLVAMDGQRNKEALATITQAVAQRNPDFCNQITTSGKILNYKIQCYYQAAITAGARCNEGGREVMSEADKNQCLQDLATRYKESDICGFIRNPSAKYECFDRLGMKVF